MSSDAVQCADAQRRDQRVVRQRRRLCSIYGAAHELSRALRATASSMWRPRSGGVRRRVIRLRCSLCSLPFLCYPVSQPAIATAALGLQLAAML